MTNRLLKLYCCSGDDLLLAYFEQRYTDHRKPEDDNRSERIKKNVNECVRALNHEDPRHQQTYKRIMSRGRVVEQDMGNVAEDQASANDAAYQPSPR